MIDGLERFWRLLSSINQWNILEGWLTTIFITIAIIVGVLCVLQLLLKVIKAWKELGLPTSLSADERERIRQRQQFCKVLRGDVAYINKAESWNDQSYTDLEAEVEAEGGYYSSILARLFQRRSFGLRRVASLIEAIETSTEQSLLLVGDPGSGKSVALRHLALQLAERGSKSTSRKAVVPLYVNLKELPAAPAGGPTADFIKEFVIDNLRRGDADTADFIHEHWNDYRKRGIWNFLFDSFDEIPAVMHAATGSPVISQHANAIRQFLDGMSDCSGILASREFKGPQVLPWQKFRILTLSQQRQEQLVANAFLTKDQRLIVRQHLASGTTTLRHNPLFLTLLCRYVKREKQAPVNDHDLLERHLVTLAGRDRSYVARQYNLSPQELLACAEQIAVLFAESLELSLAPTQDEIAAEIAKDDVLDRDLEMLLAALVYVKIGRCDVREARLGDQRFTFAHRRYQETLYVLHLSSHPDRRQPRELLTDIRWREYVVSLLQTQSAKTLKPILDEACNLLDAYTKEQEKEEILSDMGGHLTYFRWQSGGSETLLNMLQEGLAARLYEVPSKLQTAVFQYLNPYWESGDPYDRYMVLELSGLVPRNELVHWLSWAVLKGGAQFQLVAFKRATNLGSASTQLVLWVRERMAEEILLARTHTDLLKVDALGARIPIDFGVSNVTKCCHRIRPIVLFPPLLFRVQCRRLPPTRVIFIIGFVSFLYAALLLPSNKYLEYFVPSLSSDISTWWAAVSFGVIGIIFTTVGLYLAEAIDPGSTRKAIGQTIVHSPQAIRRASRQKLVWGVALTTIVIGVLFAFNVLLTIGILISIILSLSLIITIMEKIDGRRKRHRLKDILADRESAIPAVFRAGSVKELRVWLDVNADSLLPTLRHYRSLCRILSSDAPPQLNLPEVPPLFREGFLPLSAKSGLVNFLIEKIHEKRKRELEKPIERRTESSYDNLESVGSAVPVNDYGDGQKTVLSVMGDKKMTNELIDAIGLNAVAGTDGSDRIADLIFVHGLGGGSQTTWAAEGKRENFWPAWIAEEFSQLGVWTLGYGTTISAWKERSMPLADLGNQILEELHVGGIGSRPVIFVTHSMGGLVAKQILSHAQSQGVARWEKIAAKTRGIAFLATPHSGANLANFAEFVSIVLRTNEQASELQQHSSRLRELHGTFLKFVKDQKLVCRTYAERREVKPGITIFKWNVKIPKGILVVDETSAEPNIPGERAIPLDEDHISICKPIDRNTQVYKYVRSFIRDCLESTENSS